MALLILFIIAQLYMPLSLIWDSQFCQAVFAFMLQCGPRLGSHPPAQGGESALAELFWLKC